MSFTGLILAGELSLARKSQPPRDMTTRTDGTIFLRELMPHDWSEWERTMMAYLMFAGSRWKVFSSASSSGVTQSKFVLMRMMPAEVVSAQVDSVFVPM